MASKPTYVRDSGMSAEHRISRLATYNAEVYRGIVHTDEWHEMMGKEQAWFDRRNRDELIAQGGKEVGRGVWLVPSEPKQRWRSGLWRNRS